MVTEAYTNEPSLTGKALLMPEPCVGDSAKPQATYSSPSGRQLRDRNKEKKIASLFFLLSNRVVPRDVYSG